MELVSQEVLNNVYVIFISVICMHIVLMIVGYLIDFAANLFKKGV